MLSFLVAAGCGAVSTQTLDVSYSVAPADFARAIVERFPQTLAPDDTAWPESAPEVSADLSLVRSAPVNLATPAPPFAGQSIRIVSASASTVGPDTPLDAMEWLVGPADSVDELDVAVRPVARGEVPRGGAARELVFGEDGRADLADALAGKLPEQGKVAKFLLFLRATMPVHLRPGDALPAGTDATRVVIRLSFEYGP